MKPKKEELQVKNPARITLRNVWAVIQAFFRKKRRGLGGFDLPDHLYEQIFWRRTVADPICWNQGVCKECGCEMIGKTMEDRGCDGKCYPDMMNKSEWKEFKQVHNIKLFK
jgi:hypothetical protein